MLCASGFSLSELGHVEDGNLAVDVICAYIYVTNDNHQLCAQYGKLKFADIFLGISFGQCEAIISATERIPLSRLETMLLPENHVFFTKKLRFEKSLLKNLICLIRSEQFLDVMDI